METERGKLGQSHGQDQNQGQDQNHGNPLLTDHMNTAVVVKWKVACGAFIPLLPI